MVSKDNVDPSSFFHPLVHIWPQVGGLDFLRLRRPIDSKVIGEFGDLGIFKGITMLGVNIGIGTEIIRHAFVVESGHPKLGSSVEGGGPRVPIQASTNDGFVGSVGADRFNSLLTPPSRLDERVSSLVMGVDVREVFGVWVEN